MIQEDMNTAVITKVENDLPNRWVGAFEGWLGGLAENSQRAYRQGLKDLMRTLGSDAPWLISAEDVTMWVEDMRRRGLSEGTVGQRLACVGSFYRFAIESARIFEGANPVGGRRRVRGMLPFGKAVHLNVEEARMLLAVIDQGTPRGRRDYALILGYLMTGRRNSEWRRLRWEDIEVVGERVFYRWQGKGTSRRDEMPGVVYQRIKDKGERKDGGYVFTADGVDEALSDRGVRRIVKRYARLAGLDARRIRVHSLRHTAAMLRRDAGGDIEEISGFLGHRSIGITQVYLHRLEGQSDGLWMKVAELLSL